MRENIIRWVEEVSGRPFRAPGLLARGGGAEGPRIRDFELEDAGSVERPEH